MDHDNSSDGGVDTPAINQSAQNQFAGRMPESIQMDGMAQGTHACTIDPVIYMHDVDAPN
jgi:hypothetical protein